MLPRPLRRALGATAIALALPSSASAGRLLFVSDSETDRNIPAALRAAGHVVDVVLNDYAGGNQNVRLQQPLTGYDAVFWSASGPTGRGEVHTAVTTAALASYVRGGGYLFVTGIDPLVSPPDPELVAFLGGTGASDLPAAPAPAISAANELTTGVVDLRGVAPSGGSGDRDALLGLAPDTVAVVGTADAPGQVQWALRTLGEGRIAFVSNGDGGTPTEHPSWRNTAAGGAGAYNAALRNFAFHASGARVLFVSDSQTDTNLPDVLRADGHRVTVVLDDFGTGNARLRGSLAGYDAVVWSATGYGYGEVHATAVTNALADYARAGGFLYVTGIDTLVSPPDPPLVALLGGSSASDLPAAPSAVIDAANELTTGVVDLRGVTPTGGNGDRDAIFGLGADTVSVVATAGASTLSQWTLRTLGAGRVAYVSNGLTGPVSAHPSWNVTTADGAGAYNASVRNFVFHASGARVLFVSDSQTDTNLPDVLRADGHRVTVVLDDFGTGNARLRASLANYDAVVWSATGYGYGEVHATAVTSALAGYARGGGRLFVTGIDTLVSPPDPPLVALLGGSDAVDLPAAPTAVVDVANELTTGLVNLRGVTPTGGNGDRDALLGLGTDTVAVVATMGAPAQAQWTLRTLGAGRIAYVSNGLTGPASAHPSWGAAGGAYNAAVRNFVYRVDRGPVGAVTGLSNGVGCADASQCASGFCADGVCCNSQCAGGVTDCQACAVVAGSATNGTCGPVAAGRGCRASTGVCDAAEVCDGAATACPADAPVRDGTSCGDGLTCNGAEACRAGACVAGTAPSCDDADPCTTDRCAEPSGCSHTAIVGCADAGNPVDAGRDVGVGTDGSGADAGTAVDAGTARDVGAVTDAGVDVVVIADTGVDVVVIADAGVDVGAIADAGVAPDTGVAVDAGSVVDLGPAVDVATVTDVGAPSDQGTIREAGPPSDVATGPDAGTEADGSVDDVVVATDAPVEEVAAAVDAGPRTDAPAVDASAVTDASPADVTDPVDGGPPGRSLEGCGCRTPGPMRDGSRAWLLVGLALLGRRRRPCR